MKEVKMVEGEKEYTILLKGKEGHYRQVYPLRNKDGSLNWFNILTGGSWGSLTLSILIVLIILMGSYGYYHDTKLCRDLQNNKELAMSWCGNVTSQAIKAYDYNVTLINLTFGKVDAKTPQGFGG